MLPNRNVASPAGEGAVTKKTSFLSVKMDNHWGLFFSRNSLNLICRNVQ